MRDTVLVLALGLGLALTLGTAPVRGQQPAQETQEGVTLVYEREVFVYSMAGRRDPFMPLTSQEGLGPRFEELTLEGIIYTTVPGRSVALIRAADELFRVRPGDQIGNARVVEIGPLRVVFAVDNFGQVRQEMLELRKEGAGG